MGVPNRAVNTNPANSEYDLLIRHSRAYSPSSPQKGRRAGLDAAVPAAGAQSGRSPAVHPGDPRAAYGCAVLSVGREIANPRRVGVRFPRTAVSACSRSPGPGLRPRPGARAGSPDVSGRPARTRSARPLRGRPRRPGTPPTGGTRYPSETLLGRRKMRLPSHFLRRSAALKSRREGIPPHQPNESQPVAQRTNLLKGD